MSYFNLKIYNKQNLKEAELKELEYWQAIFENVIKDAELDENSYTTGSATLGKIKAELIHDFCEKLRRKLGYALQEEVVGIIDGYDGDIPEVENPDTFLYCIEK